MKHYISEMADLKTGKSIAVFITIGTSIFCLSSPCLVLSEDLVQKKQKPTV